MNDIVIPSRKPSDEGHLAGIMKLAMRKTLESTDGQLPCKIISYNRTTNRALVQPLIDMVTTAGKPVTRAQVASVPVLSLGGGGYCITFPLKTNDLGWIEASDRDISLFMKFMAESKPNTFRIHSFEDGRFIPDVFAQYAIAGEDAANMTIQSLDGTVKIALGAGVINIKSSGTVNINTTGDTTVTAGGKATVTASEIDLIGTGGIAKGVVQQDCVCAFTGVAHPMVSAKVKGSM